MHTNTAAPNWTPAEREQLQHEARALGAFGATYQPKAIGKSLPASTTLRDCRDKVARDFIAGCDPSVLWLLPELLEGFDDEAEARYTLRALTKDRAPIAAGSVVWCVDDEGADGLLTIGREYAVQATRAGGWLCIADDGGDCTAWHHACHFILA
jgi:hypothetical protein